VWARGTSFADSPLGYTADRWLAHRGGGVAGATFVQSTDVPAGFYYSMIMQRQNGNASTASLNMYYSAETRSSYRFRGTTATLSFWVKAGANYSGGAGANVALYYGTGTDQRVYAFTGSTSICGLTVTPTTTWTRYSVSGSVPASATQLGIIVNWSPTGTAGAADTVLITGVQVEDGATVSDFGTVPFEAEKQRCLRYYRQTQPSLLGEPSMYGISTVIGQPFIMSINHPVPMRVAPTLTTAGTFNLGAVGTPTITSESIDSYRFQVTTTVTGQWFVNPNFSAILKFDAEI